MITLSTSVSQTWSELFEASISHNDALHAIAMLKFNSRNWWIQAQNVNEDLSWKCIHEALVTMAKPSTLYSVIRMHRSLFHPHFHSLFLYVMWIKVVDSSVLFIFAINLGGGVSENWTNDDTSTEWQVSKFRLYRWHRWFAMKPLQRGTSWADPCCPFRGAECSPYLAENRSSRLTGVHCLIHWYVWARNSWSLSTWETNHCRVGWKRDP